MLKLNKNQFNFNTYLWLHALEYVLSLCEYHNLYGRTR